MISAGHPITDFYTDTGIANNVVADIEYMSGVLSRATLTLGQRNKINTEYTRSQPTTTLEKKAICPPDEPGKTKSFWDSLIHMHIAPCQ